jgi:hypothetical protein
MAYSPATSADLILRHPAFAAVASDTIDYWLAEGVTETATWSDDARARGEIAYAAHLMAAAGALGGPVVAGVTSFKSGSFSANIAESVASRTGFEATSYGQEYLALRRREFSGPFLAGPSHVC